MADLVVFKNPKAPQNSGPITVNGVTMCKWSQVTPLLGLYLDMDDNWRLATGEHRGFRGYAMREFDQWVVSAWCGGGKPKAWRQPNMRYKTEGGAVRALERMARFIEG